MAASSPIVVALWLFIGAVAISMWGPVEGSVEHRLSWVRASTTSGGRCRGSIAECMAENEYDMDSENNRRILATTQYISYGALQRNTVPCSRRGASYYNCQEGAEANPYNRECSTITRCRS
ncbi:Rapid ALkalinization Factor [Trema orientale]|uniref:Rapid ALkalinization Factor n=1 Tax=Trema orientale TaxID=63057 RepID=A0A2P5FFM0_TREOI|nr:Rapid ALkalinization Factor [Trema orientale]